MTEECRDESPLACKEDAGLQHSLANPFSPERLLPHLLTQLLA